MPPRNLVQPHPFIRDSTRDAQRPHDQRARLEPEARQPVDEAADRADIVRSEIGIALGMGGFDRWIERPQRAAMEQRQGTRAQCQAAVGAQQLVERRDRAGRSADDRDPWPRRRAELAVRQAKAAFRQ